MMDRNSEEFRQLIAIPLTEILEQRDPLLKYVVDPAWAKTKSAVGGALKTATDYYTKPIKAAYGAASGGLTTAGTKAAGAIGLSPATAAKVGAAAGSPLGMGVAAAGVGAAAGAAIYAGYKLYKKYLTQMGRACRNAPNPRACELQYQIRAKKAQVQGMTDGMHHCKSRECYAAVDLKINQIKREIDGLNAQLSKIPPPARPESERREDEVFKGKSTKS